ncbi:hypothetical protein JYU14_03935 [Simkania negevensis]|uniref:Flagellin n=1 Tax=Simkania negevensis TaxID=83561 RepID=A0ABS3ASB2_9BACT|nr:hypothetical protein [Simkania negevensis]
MFVSSFGFSLSGYYQRSKTDLQSAMERLASGDRIGRAGEDPAHLSLSERLRFQIQTARASEKNILSNNTLITSAHIALDEVSNILSRLIEIAGVLSQRGAINSSDIQGYEDEFIQYRDQLHQITRTSTFNNKQTISRSVIVSFNSHNSANDVRFWQDNGNAPGKIDLDFGPGATDTRGNNINFASARAFTMSGDGQSFFYIGSDNFLHRYDIASQMVYTGSDTFAATDTLFVDHNDILYANGSGTLYTINEGTVARAAHTAGITTMQTGGQFVVSENEITYFDTTESNLIRRNLGSGSITQDFNSLSNASADYIISPTGRYIADTLTTAGNVTIYDTIEPASIVSTTKTIGTSASSVVDAQFDKNDANLYYIDDNTHAIEAVSVSSDVNKSVIIGDSRVIIQGISPSSFGGLSLGGVNFNSNVSFAIQQGNLIDYNTIDTEIYTLGIGLANVFSESAAVSARALLEEAANRVASKRTYLHTQETRFGFLLEETTGYVAELENFDQNIRSADIAVESEKIAMLQVQNSATLAMLAQYNALRQSVLQLLLS